MKEKNTGGKRIRSIILVFMLLIFSFSFLVMCSDDDEENETEISSEEETGSENRESIEGSPLALSLIHI